jgi:hypothetical protein
VALGVAGAAALLLPVRPDPLALVLLAVGTAALVRSLLRPGGSGPAVVLGAAAAEQAVAGGPGALRVGLLALALAAVHAAAALAAVTPRAAAVERGVLLRWGGRTAATAAAGLLVVGGSTLLPAPPPVAATVAGLLAVFGLLGGVLALRRRAAGDAGADGGAQVRRS